MSDRPPESRLSKAIREYEILIQDETWDSENGERLWQEMRTLSHDKDPELGRLLGARKLAAFRRSAWCGPRRRAQNPISLRIHRESGGTWRGRGEWKTDTRNNIRRDQLGLCAYCERPLPTAFEIDHFHPMGVPKCTEQTNMPDDGNWALTWTNLFGVCDVEGQLINDVHGCNDVKQNNDWCDEIVHPLSKRRPATSAFRVAPDGTLVVRSDYRDPIRAQCTIDRLQLQRLAAQRKAFRDEVESRVQVVEASEVLRALLTNSPQFITTIASPFGEDAVVRALQEHRS